MFFVSVYALGVILVVYANNSDKAQGADADTIAAVTVDMTPHKPSAGAAGIHKRGVGDVCARRCSGYLWWRSCTTYYCETGNICCERTPSSKCCATHHPVCVTNGCCPEAFPKECGNLCCSTDKVCCKDKQTCCKKQEQCCGDKCCKEGAKCCKAGKEPKCYDKEQSACCDNSGVTSCPSPFDAAPCTPPGRIRNVFLQSEREMMAHVTVQCDEYFDIQDIYRVIRPDEDCYEGLSAKDPGAKKTVHDHVNCGSEYGFTSQFISTTTEYSVANKWYQNSEGARIAVITKANIAEAQCIAYDLTLEEERNKHLKTNFAKNNAKASCEVVLKCKHALECEVMLDK